ncbi:flagellar hook assembly protein FlgD [Thalassoroseus pseudoceratinae]|uniref:hypothetical protein n=1 Tax=Thalassoroseus pseudoceratinae TaxID=2713176 RepID=UPI001420D4A8|nr:hypothetical protein [Thalassoroseus pseudoceratinae]
MQRHFAGTSKVREQNRVPLNSLMFPSVSLVSTLAVFATMLVNGWGHVSVHGAESGDSSGAKVTYQLPMDGPLPKTYQVTLAITDADNPDWVISTFVAAAVRTVTAENQGRFTEFWNGLDDNFMPVPAGEYGVKGIYMPAEKWDVTGEYRGIIPQYIGSPTSWNPDHTEDRKRLWQAGNPKGLLRDVATSLDGKAVVYHDYLENNLNAFLFDLTKPIGHAAGIKSYPSGGAAGGQAVATDGTDVWAFSDNGTPDFIHRGEGKFGYGRGRWRRNVYPVEQVVRDLAVRKFGDRPRLFVVQPGTEDNGNGRLIVLDGYSSEELFETAFKEPRAVTLSAEQAFVLHRDGDSWAISRLRLGRDGVPQVSSHSVLKLSSELEPHDLSRDTAGRFYVSLPTQNQVVRLDEDGRIALRLGSEGQQKPGSYDPNIFMSPHRLAMWTDDEGHDRLLVLEYEGANRLSEWSLDGKLLRRWIPTQSHSHLGSVAYDPDRPNQIYVTGNAGGLVRYNVDFEGGPWTVDAVWPDICQRSDRWPGGVQRIEIKKHNERKYLVCCDSTKRDFGVIVYRQDGDNWVLSAGLIPDPNISNSKRKFVEGWWWHDADGEGDLDVEEYENNPAKLPRQPGYWGEKWLDDLSLIFRMRGEPQLMRLAPRSFDEHGNPIFHGDDWEMLLTDPIYEAKQKGQTLPATRGGNEVAEGFSTWGLPDGSLDRGFYVPVRGDTKSANHGLENKLIHYEPDGNGGYRLKWRVGRAAFATAEPGETYSQMQAWAPLGGLIGVNDSSYSTVHLYTSDGLYVTSVLPDDRVHGRSKLGAYFQPGEHFLNGFPFAHGETGQVYLSIGKTTPVLYRLDGWTRNGSPVRRLKDVSPTVTLRPKQIAKTPTRAVAMRGGLGTAPYAKFRPFAGDVAMDGSIQGWTQTQPITYSGDSQGKQRTEIHGLYDRDNHYLRMHVRKSSEFVPQDLHPLNRVFTHDRESDVVSFYMQCNPDPPAKYPAVGRRGDVRFVFTMGKNEEGKVVPAALAMHPVWLGNGQGKAMSYGSLVGEAPFEHVAPADEVRLSGRIDEDNKGFVIVATIPRSALPNTVPEFRSGLRTFINFSTTLGGHNKFWWANTDGSANIITQDEPSEAGLYPGSWAPLELEGFTNGVPVRRWLTLGPWGGPELQDPSLKAQDGSFKDIQDKNKKARIRAILGQRRYPPDLEPLDFNATYEGPLTGNYRDRKRRIFGEATLRWTTQEIPSSKKPVLELGPSSQLHYAVTWIHVPEQMELDATFYLGEFIVSSIHIGDEEVVRTKRDVNPPVKKRITLQKGWNRIFYRGHSAMYDNVIGLVLDSEDKDKLWNISFSAMPPESEDTKASN